LSHEASHEPPGHGPTTDGVAADEDAGLNDMAVSTKGSDRIYAVTDALH
jgi:hypothetical protein